MILTVCPNPSVDAYAFLSGFELGKANRIQKLQEFPGGKGVHVALALAELKVPVALMGSWAGGTGKWIREECRKMGVEPVGIELSGTNRKCFTFRSADPNCNDTELLEPGPEMYEHELDSFMDLFHETIADYQLICMSGSWPAGTPVFAYKQLALIAASLGKKVILDCSGPALKMALEAPLFGLHLNADEAVGLCGSSDPERVFEVLSPKVKLIAFTKGKEGLYLSYMGEQVHAKVDLGEVRSAVGSGDCLTAGIAYGLLNNLDVTDIARWGVACGAANCLRPELGMLHANDVKNLLNQIKVNANSL